MAELKDTLNLPETEFPMRASLVEREPQRIEHWEKHELYHKIQQKAKDAKPFILHDGPPFTNGDVHIGTALNKILKDVILRYKTMRGYRTPYHPGWDCHGLPIEHKVSKEIRKKKQDLSIPELREACAEFSRSYIEKQRDQFTRLGILADWDNEYKTMDPKYEATILETFASFVEQGLVYRSKKPVYWSIPCATALAEAEIEYQDHTSPSIWVRFPLSEEDSLKLNSEAPVSVLIWTTTPWTLPANMALAVHPRLEYVQLHHDGQAYLVAQDLAESVITSCKLEGATLGKTHEGETLEGLKAQHPFIDRESPIVLADYVTTETGSGCVHTAPGHGLDDYLTGLKYGLDVYCPLDDRGCYEDDDQIPAELVGLSVLQKGTKHAANEAVLEMAAQHIVHKEDYNHQYPHCWRSKTPVIFRAMDQWFVELDKNDNRQKALDAIEQVTWTPSWGKNRIKGAVEARPDWCISRQRSWGVPIVVFYKEDGTPLLDASVIKAIAEKIKTQGTQYWFEASSEELLEGIILPEGFNAKELTKGTDTLDVWIDSGCSHRAVLQKHKELEWPADLYFEGSDQHRGWFQSSLWTALLADGKPGYKHVITHGFVVDQNKRKISKSDGKPQTADSYIKKYGADIMRLWISSEDYKNDVPLSDNIIKQVVQAYRTIRNTLRFQLGNLSDFDISKHEVAASDMTAIDQWALYETNTLIEKVTQAYEKYDFHRAYQYLTKFCSIVLSATYHDVLKDRLYTYGPDWKERRASQSAIYHIFNTFTRLIAPMLTFTSDEAFSYLKKDKGSEESFIHLQDWPTLRDDWNCKQAHAEIEQILTIRNQVNEALEGARQSKLLGQSMDARVCINMPEGSSEYEILEKYRDNLPELFIVSQVALGIANEASVSIEHAQGVRCPRSWRWVPELVECEGYEKVSPRCKKALESKY